MLYQSTKKCMLQLTHQGPALLVVLYELIMLPASTAPHTCMLHAPLLACSLVCLLAHQSRAVTTQ